MGFGFCVRVCVVFARLKWIFVGNIHLNGVLHSSAAGMNPVISNESLLLRPLILAKKLILAGVGLS